MTKPTHPLSKSFAHSYLQYHDFGFPAIRGNMSISLRVSTAAENSVQEASLDAYTIEFAKNFAVTREIQGTSMKNS